MGKYCHFWSFCKGYSKAKWSILGTKFWSTNWMTDPHVKETGTSKWRKHCHVFTWPYAIHFIPKNMVRTRVRGNLRMRKQNNRTTIPLDVVLGRRTERFPPRFRPVDCFCELRFRYLSSPTGREGEISRCLDHMRQIPFIYSARLLVSTNFYIEQSSRYFLHVARSGV